MCAVWYPIQCFLVNCSVFFFCPFHVSCQTVRSVPRSVAGLQPFPFPPRVCSLPIPASHPGRRSDYSSDRNCKLSGRTGRLHTIRQPEYSTFRRGYGRECDDSSGGTGPGTGGGGGGGGTVRKYIDTAGQRRSGFRLRLVKL